MSNYPPKQPPHHSRRPEDAEVDVIDGLDDIGMGLHHDGPYDAAMPSENRNRATAPMAAFSREAQSEAKIPDQYYDVIYTHDERKPEFGEASAGLGETTFVEGAPANSAAAKEIAKEEKEEEEAHKKKHHFHLFGHKD